MNQKDKFSREPITIVEVVQDFCGNQYGVPPCRAGLVNLAKLTGFRSQPAFIDIFGQPVEVLYPKQVLVSYAQWELTPQSFSETAPDGASATYVVKPIGDGSTTFGPIFFEFPVTILQGHTGSYFASAAIKRNGYGRYVWVTLGDSSTVVYGAVLDMSNGTIVHEVGSVTASATAFDSMTISDLGNGWLGFELEAETLTGDDVRLAFTPFQDGVISFEHYMDIKIAMIQVSTNQGQQYAITYESEWVNTSPQPCFNTIATCQSEADYSLDELPLRFVSSRSPQLTDGYYLPFLDSVSLTPASINPAGAKQSQSITGKRATISANFIDAPHDDKRVDPYREQRDYDPLKRSTFAAKWRARNPYYLHRPMRLISGYMVDGKLVDSITRNFVITGFSGPNRGTWSLDGKDLLTLIENTKAQAPALSEGKLDADITETDTSATLAPSGIGSTYPESGTLRIGKECIKFTRVDDVLTFTERPSDGTKASDHSAGDLVQDCLRIDSKSVAEILELLLGTYAGLPASFLNTVQWSQEVLDFMPRLYSALITEPEGINKLVSEMNEQMFFNLVHDDRTDLIEIRAVRPATDEQIESVDSRFNLIASSDSWKDLTDSLVTQVDVYHGQLDPTEKLDQADNYAAAESAWAQSEEARIRQNARSVKTIFSRWIDAGNAAAALDLANKIVNRFGRVPRELSFALDAKDDFRLSSFIRVNSSENVDQFGNEKPVNLQIVEVQESSIGTARNFIAHEFQNTLAEQVTDPSKRTVIMNSSLLNVNLRTLHDSQYGEPKEGDDITFIVRPGIYIGGDAAGGGVNVPYLGRNTFNDVYASGVAAGGKNYGDLIPLFRQGLAAPETYAYNDQIEVDGSLYDMGLPGELYPVSTAIKTGTWPNGVTLKLIVSEGAGVLGQGGSGGIHFIGKSLGISSYFNVREPLRASDGGHALHVEHPISIENRGLIAGGGGGGTGGVLALTDGNVFLQYGGGGAGFHYSAVKESGPAGKVFSQRGVRTSAVPGTLLQGGIGQTYAISATFLGSTLAYSVNKWEDRGQSRGGDLGQAGESANVKTHDSGIVELDFGGLAGALVSAGAGLVTWINRGDLRGAENV